MEKYIEDIIEIILEDVSCDHQVDSDGAGQAYYDVTYCLRDKKEVIRKAIEAIAGRLIERPEITKEFIENKTSQMEQMFMQRTNRKDREFFIVSLIKKAQEGTK